MFLTKTNKQTNKQITTTTYALLHVSKHSNIWTFLLINKYISQYSRLYELDVSLSMCVCVLVFCSEGITIITLTVGLQMRKFSDNYVKTIEVLSLPTGVGPGIWLGRGGGVSGGGVTGGIGVMMTVETSVNQWISYRSQVKQIKTTTTCNNEWHVRPRKPVVISKKN